MANNRNGGLNPSDPNIVQRIVELFRVWNGEGRDPDQAVVTRGELRRIFGLGPAVQLPRGFFERVEQVVEETVPPGDEVEMPTQPVGVTVTAGSSVVLTYWTAPSYLGHAHTEVWRSTADLLGGAVLVQQAYGSMFTDRDIASGVTYYYWFRHINRDGVEGPWNATAGTEAKPYVRQGYLLDALTQKIVKTEVFSDLTAGVGFGYADGLFYYGIAADRFVVMNPDVPYGSADTLLPFVIDGSGKTWINVAGIAEATIDSAKMINVEVEKLVVLGSSDPNDVADAIIPNLFVNSAKIANVIQSDNWDGAAGTGWRIKKDGTIVANQITARGHIEGASGGFSDSVVIGARTVGGVNADIDGAYNAASDAGNRLDDWERPGTTRIDGNKIYTGDAYVDTLQIKGNAVTIPYVDAPADQTPQTFAADTGASAFGDNFSAGELARLTFDTNDLASSRPLLVHFSARRRGAYPDNPTLADLEGFMRSQTQHYWQTTDAQGTVTGEGYAPGRTYIRLELWRNGSRVRVHWEIAWQEVSKTFAVAWAPTVYPNYNYQVRALVSSSKNYEMSRIVLSTTVGLR